LRALKYIFFVLVFGFSQAEGSQDAGENIALRSEALAADTELPASRKIVWSSTRSQAEDAALTSYLRSNGVDVAWYSSVTVASGDADIYITDQPHRDKTWQQYEQIASIAGDAEPVTDFNVSGSDEAIRIFSAMPVGLFTPVLVSDPAMQKGQYGAQVPACLSETGKALSVLSTVTYKPAAAATNSWSVSSRDTVAAINSDRAALVALANRECSSVTVSARSLEGLQGEADLVIKDATSRWTVKPVDLGDPSVNAYAGAHTPVGYYALQLLAQSAIIRSITDE